MKKLITIAFSLLLLSITTTKSLAQCDTPQNMLTGARTPTSVAYTWTAPPNAMGYEYAVTLSSTNPVLGSYIQATAVMLTGLSCNRPYVFFVRTNCANGTNSDWIKREMVTECLQPKNVTAVSVSQNQATIIWTPETCAATKDYEYAVKTDSTIPLANGTPVKDTFVTVPNLVAGTVYYAFIRTICGPRMQTDWKRIQFFTPFVTSVDKINRHVGEFFIYPNPATNTLSIDATDAYGKLTLFNTIGQNIGEQNFNTRTVIDISALSTGVYYLRYDGNFGAKTFKFTKQ